MAGPDDALVPPPNVCRPRGRALTVVSFQQTIVVAFQARGHELTRIDRDTAANANDNVLAIDDSMIHYRLDFLRRRPQTGAIAFRIEVV